MSLDYYFLDENQVKPDIEISNPIKFGYLIKHAFTLDEIKYFESRLNDLPWKIQEIMVAGKTYLPQRETLGFATERHLIEKRSSFGMMFPEIITEIQQKVQQLITDHIHELPQPVMNYCWGNRYRSGMDKVGKHKDNEKWHSRIDPIVSVSFGIHRHFDVFSPYKRIERFELGFGDIFLMMPGFQQAYFHAIPVQKKIHNSRINLTFRSLERPPTL